LLFLEGHARLLLVVHAVLGAATVAVASHLFVWTWKLVRRDQPGRIGAIRWFATVGLILYVLQFALGNLMYPVYKVRVRGEYLEMPSSVVADATARRAAHAELGAKTGARVSVDDAPVPRLEPVARAFDVKEHWIVLALPMSVVACLLAWRWKPRDDGAAGGRLLLLCAGSVAVATWLAAVIGIVVTSYRSIAPPL
jgi:cytochrome bd-type quinol oxidase subunit 2